MFFKKKPNSDEFDKLAKKIAELQVDLTEITEMINRLYNRIDMNESKIASNRLRIGKMKGEIVVEESSTGIQDGFDELRKLNKLGSP